MLRKLLCLIGWHTWRFWGNLPFNEEIRPAVGCWRCERCDAHKKHWYVWVTREHGYQGQD
jgi:hypothetical protein